MRENSQNLSLGLGALGVFAAIIGIPLAVSGQAAIIWPIVVWLVCALLAMLAAHDETTLGKMRRLPDWMGNSYANMVAGLIKRLEHAIFRNHLQPGDESEEFEVNFLSTLEDGIFAGDKQIQALSQNPWSWPVLDLSLRFAILYPMLFALIQFSFSGQSVRIYDTLLVGADIPIWAAVVAVVSCFFIFFSKFIDFVRFRKSFSKPIRSTGIIILLGLALLLVATISFNAGGGPYAVATVFLAAVAFALAGPGAGIAALAHTVAWAAFFVTLALISRTGWNNNFLQIASYLVMFASVFGIIEFFRQPARRHFAHFACLFFLILGVSMALWLLSKLAFSDERAGLIIAVCLFPLVNALFDWASYGTTFALLKYGERKRGWAPTLLAIADLFLAAAYFFLLAMAFTGLLAAVNFLAGFPRFDLNYTLDRIKDGSGNHQWIAFMVVTTFVPTAVHFGLGMLSLITYVPGRIWGYLTMKIGPEASVLNGFMASLALPVSAILATLPIGIFLAGTYSLWLNSEVFRGLFIDALIRSAPWL